MINANSKISACPAPENGWAFRMPELLLMKAVCGSDPETNALDPSLSASRIDKILAVTFS